MTLNINIVGKMRASINCESDMCTKKRNVLMCSKARNVLMCSKERNVLIEWTSRRLGVIVQPGNRIRFVRACVRAKLRVPVRRCCFRGWAAEASKLLRGRVLCRVPFAVLCENHSLVLRRLVDRSKSLQIDVRQRRTALESV